MDVRYLPLLLTLLAAGQHLRAAADEYPPPAPAYPPKAPPPPAQPQLPRPECPDIDFADLVLKECAPPPPPPVVKKYVHHPYPHKHSKAPHGHWGYGNDYHSHGPPPHYHVVVHPAPPKPIVRDAAFQECEQEVTARELFKAITETKDQQCVAQILVQTASVGGIEGGFRIPMDFNFRPNCGNREADPDVIAVKASALGILNAAGVDPNLVDKIVDGIVPSLTPEGEVPPPPTPAKKTCVKVPVTVHNVTTFEQKCTITPEKTHSVDRDQLFDKLNNLTLMTEVFFQDANKARPCNNPEKYLPKNAQQPPPASGRRLFSDFVHGRSLHCSDCDNADSFPCSYCWQQVVCGDMYWCQDE